MKAFYLVPSQVDCKIVCSANKLIYTSEFSSILLFYILVAKICKLILLVNKINHKIETSLSINAYKIKTWKSHFICIFIYRYINLSKD